MAVVYYAHKCLRLVRYSYACKVHVAGAIAWVTLWGSEWDPGIDWPPIIVGITSVMDWTEVPEIWRLSPEYNTKWKLTKKVPTKTPPQDLSDGKNCSEVVANRAWSIPYPLHLFCTRCTLLAVSSRVWKILGTTSLPTTRPQLINR